jgi:light-regulated signal transduction histidine kinase (bacteriophytochrome)
MDSAMAFTMAGPIVKAIAEVHRGAVGVESEPGAGSTFSA